MTDFEFLKKLDGGKLPHYLTGNLLEQAASMKERGLLIWRKAAGWKIADKGRELLNRPE